MYEIEVSESALGELDRIRPHDRNPILDAIEEQLLHVPHVETRNRKPLSGLVPPFEAVLPVWELRVGEYRVYYDFDPGEKKVRIRAVRRKFSHLSTEEIL